MRFFCIVKAPAGNEPAISKSVKQVVDNLDAYLEQRIDLKLKQSATFIGYFVEGSDKDLFKKIAENFADAVRILRKCLIFPHDNYRY